MNMIIGIQLQVQNGSSFLHSRGRLLRLLYRLAALAAMVQALLKVLQHMQTILNQPVNLTQLQCQDMETVQHTGSCRIHQRFGPTLYGIFQTLEMLMLGSTLEHIPSAGIASEHYFLVGNTQRLVFSGGLLQTTDHFSRRQEFSTTWKPTGGVLLCLDGSSMFKNTLHDRSRDQWSNTRLPVNRISGIDK